MAFPLLLILCLTSPERLGVGAAIGENMADPLSIGGTGAVNSLGTDPGAGDESWASYVGAGMLSANFLMAAAGLTCRPVDWNTLFSTCWYAALAVLVCLAGPESADELDVLERETTGRIPISGSSSEMESLQ